MYVDYVACFSSLVWLRVFCAGWPLDGTGYIYSAIWVYRFIFHSPPGNVLWCPLALILASGPEARLGQSDKEENCNTNHQNK